LSLTTVEITEAWYVEINKHNHGRDYRDYGMVKMALNRITEGTETRRVKITDY
jgi:hypothetical protein